MQDDPTTRFYVDVLTKLISAGTFSKSDKVLVVCGGPLDEAVMKAVGFSDATVTNLDGGTSDILQNAESLTYPDRSFDVAIVHAGLHHCASPHRALLEMYRVARKAVVVFEARDSATMRLARRIGFTPDFELEAVSHGGYEKGGVQNGPIPNFIYRWTEREVAKTIMSFDPAYVEQLEFFYGLRLPTARFDNVDQPAKRAILKLAAPVAEAFAKLFPRQGNQFGFAIIKTGKLREWMEQGDEGLRLSRQKAQERGQAYGEQVS